MAMKESIDIQQDRMPNSEEDKRILLQRKEQISKKTVDKVEYGNRETYVCFKLGINELYGIPYQSIKEVMRAVPLTKLPGAHPCIAGIINRRGVLLPVLDLKKFFNFDDLSYEKKPYILVIKGDSFTIGLLADTIEGSRVYDTVTLGPPLSFVSAIKAEYILGLHNGVVAILNIEAILSDLVALIKQRDQGNNAYQGASE